MKKLSIITVILVALTLLAIAQQQQVISRDNIQLREGPGSFYPLLSVLNKGVKIKVLKEDEGWLEVECSGQKGYISSNGISADAETEEEDSFGSFGFDEGPEVISRASASGAVKGFAQKYAKMKNMKADFVSYFEQPLITAGGFRTFKKETFRNRNSRRIQKRFSRLKVDPNEYHVTARLEKIGLAAATQIAATGLNFDKYKLEYLNNVGTLVAQQTELYYYPLKFFILQDNRPAAYATPVGMIFISEGLLDVIQNEAELACVLAHEVSHVVCQHGYQELGHRKEMIAADDAFAEMETELPDMTEDEAELEDLAYSMFEAATAPRQIEYEYEADILGAVYAYRAGYDPGALADLLRRIEANTTLDYENFESNWESSYIKDRVKRIEDFTSRKLDRHPEWNIKNASRFNQHF